ncbi:MAG: DNA primase [Dehalococcoidia bacterium]
MNEIEEVKARLDIVDVVGQYVQLQRAGRSYKAPCPFHSEKTPSFFVSPDRQSWHCFGACGDGGDVFSFVMRKEGIEFGEALRALADRAGVALRERQRRPEEDRERDRSYAANEAAARWYHELLVSGEAGQTAREYVRGRGVDEATSEAFLVGFSPPSWEATREQLRERGFSDAELLAAGLLVEGEKGLHDRFRDRLMFPIRDMRGRFVGFGARALDDSMPKYLNTAQTVVFDKGGILYALERSQDGIRREDCVVLVEGYMDAIACHQHGFDNAVATMGTSLTERQVRLLKRQTRNIVLALDADAAGSEAAHRGHEVVDEALRQGSDRETVPVLTWRGLVRYQDAASVDLRVAVLPEGSDPDDVIRSNPASWRELITSARPVLDYRFDAAATRHDLSTPRGRSEAVQELLPLLEPITDPVVRAHYLQRLSRLSLVREDELSRMVSRRRGGRRPPVSVTETPSLGTTRGDTRPEGFLLALLLRFPHLREAGLEIPDALIVESENREVLAAWRLHPELDVVKNTLPEELKGYVERLIDWRLPAYSAKEAQAALGDCRQRLERRQVETEKQAMAALLAAREEELGASSLVEAVVSGAEDADETVKEAVDLHRRDLQTGLRLHGKEGNDGKVEGGEAAETTVNG